MDVLFRRALALPAGRQLVALAGPPASGKSTLAETLAAALSDAGRMAVVVPMDGFHLDNRLLDARGLRSRKGAPETFDLRGFARLISDLKMPGEVVFPLFDRDRDLAVAGAGLVPDSCDLVVVEGNYLLFDAPGWRDLKNEWSLSAYIDAPESLLRQRLGARWLDQGLNAHDAAVRAEQNDLPNARRIAQHRLATDMTLSAGT